MKNDYQDIIAHLRTLENPRNVEGMKRFGINPEGTLGISVATIRKLSKAIGKNHNLAVELWESKIHEARILAVLIAEPAQVSEELAEKWVNDFDSWDVCDLCCNNLFDKLPFAYEKAFEWVKNEKEYVRRAGFALIVSLAVHRKKDSDQPFIDFLPIIVQYSTDERNFVKKAVNWALRQIGKRNMNLYPLAIETAEKIAQNKESKTARWVAADALTPIIHI